MVRLLSSPDKRKPDQVISRILIIRPGGIGDAVLLIPAIHRLKHALPLAEISVLAEKRNAAVFSMCPEVSSLYHYEHPAELVKLIRGRYDVVIDTEQWHRLPAIVARMTGAPLMIGFSTNERKKMFTHPIEYSHDRYEADSFLDLIAPIMENMPSVPPVPMLSVSSDHVQKTKLLLQSLHDRPIVAVFPGSSIKARRWGAERFHEASILLGRRVFSIVAIGGKEDVTAGEKIVSGLSQGLNLCGRLSLPETAAVIKQSALLITGDSGIMHIGYGLGIKIVALFGPGREKKWAPRGDHFRIINKNLSCSPCTTFGYTPKCAKNDACMENISVEEVYRASMDLLGER